jgi:fructokinase
MRLLKEFSEQKTGHIFGSIEAGGTKFVCALGSSPDAILARTTIPTETPEKTLVAALDFFSTAQEKHGKIAAFGISSFGPVDLKEGSPAYGCITTTPKPGWKNTDISGVFKKAFQVPLGFDTDVNGAALGEARWGAARGFSHVLYITVGTGIGGGALVQGLPLHGLLHPEMGHIRVPHDLSRDPFPGLCPWHGDCLEGLASGPALAQRLGKPAKDIAPDDPVWDIEADYLAAAVLNFTLCLSPQIIIMGGGVMHTPNLIEKIRQKTARLLNGYVAAEPLASDMDAYIVPPGLGDLSGIAGGFVLAEQALQAFLTRGKQHE